MESPAPFPDSLTSLRTYAGYAFLSEDFRYKLWPLHFSALKKLHETKRDIEKNKIAVPEPALEYICFGRCSSYSLYIDNASTFSGWEETYKPLRGNHYPCILKAIRKQQYQKAFMIAVSNGHTSVANEIFVRWTDKVKRGKYGLYRFKSLIMYYAISSGNPDTVDLLYKLRINNVHYYYSFIYRIVATIGSPRMLVFMRKKQAEYLKEYPTVRSAGTIKVEYIWKRTLGAAIRKNNVRYIRFVSDLYTEEYGERPLPSRQYFHDAVRLSRVSILEIFDEGATDEFRNANKYVYLTPETATFLLERKYTR